MPHAPYIPLQVMSAARDADGEVLLRALNEQAEDPDVDPSSAAAVGGGGGGGGGGGHGRMLSP